MNCNICSNDCGYKQDILMVPCEACLYSANEATSKVCKKCINDKCQFEPLVKGEL